MSSFLPDGIIENIFTRLPVKSISRFRCISKYWCTLFRNPNFIKNHLNHAILMNKFKILVTRRSNFFVSEDIGVPFLSTIDNDVLSSLPSTSSPFSGHTLNIDYPSMSREVRPTILGSSNGLVLIQTEPIEERPIQTKSICIWNPATREYKQVQETSSHPYGIDHGFGFDSKNDDYKVLKISRSDPNEEVSEASVYSLASNSWKNLGFIPYEFSSSCLDKRIHLNGVLYWVARGSIPYVVCFDISDETFHHVPFPKVKENEDGYPCRDYSVLGVWEGKLCLLCMYGTEDPYIFSHMNVWTMMDNEWSKHLKITAQMQELYDSRPIQTLHNGEILFECDLEEEEDIVLISYDPNLDRARTMKIHGFPKDDTEPYIETLVALNSSTYVGQHQRSKTKKRRNR